MEQSYGGSLLRPFPLLHFSEDPCLLIMATPWGEKKVAENLIEELVRYLSQVSEDEEKTAFHKKLSFLNLMENHLRSACLHINDLLLMENKSADFPTGVELLLIFFHQGTMYWIQKGAPNFFLHLHKGNSSFVQPFLSVHDWSQYFSSHEPIKPPLPRSMLGLHAYNDFKVESLSMASMNPTKDNLVFLTSPYIPPSFYACSDFSHLTSIVHLLSKNHGNYPFWLGVFPLKDLPSTFFSMK